MFDKLFKSNQPKYSIKNVIWKTALAKQAAILHRAMNENNLVLVYFNEETSATIQSIFSSHNIAYSMDLSSSPQIYLQSANELLNTIFYCKDKQILFIEHPFSYKYELEILDILNQKLTINSFDFYVSLDDELFKDFNSENMKSILNHLGLQDSESISHSMIDASIIKLQQKYDKK